MERNQRICDLLDSAWSTARGHAGYERHGAGMGARAHDAGRNALLNMELSVGSAIETRKLAQPAPTENLVFSD